VTCPLCSMGITPLLHCRVGGARLRAGLRPPLNLHVRISRIKCAGAHLMRYVVSPVMWPRACKMLVLKAYLSLSTT
jgi:hypothetical protein